MKESHVIPHGRGWAVRKNGRAGVVSTHRTQRDAAEAAVREAKRDGGQVVLHGRDGRIRDITNFGSVPRLPRLPYRTTKLGARRIREAVWNVTKSANA